MAVLDSSTARDGVFDGGLAAGVERLADQQDGHAAISRRGLAEQVDAVSERVKHGGPAVALFEIRERVGGEVGIAGEALHGLRVAIEADDGDFVWDSADHGVQDGIEAAVIVEVVGADAAILRDDDEGEGLLVGVLLDADFLGDAVVGDGEVFGGEGEDGVAGAVFDHDGDEDDGGGGGEGLLGLGAFGAPGVWDGVCAISGWPNVVSAAITRADTIEGRLVIAVPLGGRVGMLTGRLRLLEPESTLKSGLLIGLSL